MVKTLIKANANTTIEDKRELVYICAGFSPFLLLSRLAVATRYISSNLSILCGIYLDRMHTYGQNFSLETVQPDMKLFNSSNHSVESIHNTVLCYATVVYYA